MLELLDDQEQGVGAASGSCTNDSIAVGSPHPLGPTVRPDGVNFSVFSQNATGIQLLLFETEHSPQPIQRIDLDPTTTGRSTSGTCR